MAIYSQDNIAGLQAHPIGQRAWLNRADNTP
jgi:hypothetical protein